jgi:hypothetical protein
MSYPEAIVIDINEEPIMEGEVVGLESNYDMDIIQRKAMCCLSISITIFIIIVFGYILSVS